MKARSIVLPALFLMAAVAVNSQTPDRSSTIRSLSEIKVAGGVRAVLPNFFYEIQFRVISFDITFSGESFDDAIYHHNSGGAWDQTCQQYISRCRPGSEILIENIKVIGPDNRTRKLKDILLYELR